MSKYEEHKNNSSILIQKHLLENIDKAKKKRNTGRVEDMDLDELVNKFI